MSDADRLKSLQYFFGPQMSRARAQLSNEMAAEHDPYEGDMYRSAMSNAMRADPRSYVTSLEGDPNAPPVAYRNPAMPMPQAPAPAPSPYPEWIQRWLQNDAVRAMMQRQMRGQ